MPIITVALFALAGIVLAVAIVIQQMAGGDDGGKLSPSDQVNANATNTALASTPQNSTGTQPAGTATGSRTATSSTPPAGTTTPGAGSTPGTNAKTHTVAAGEFCATIAEGAGISLDQFFTLNPSVSRDCSNLAIGQVVNIAK
jgi:LysM repeat protein